MMINPISGVLSFINAQGQATSHSMVIQLNAEIEYFIELHYN